jgi:hypothetical protein
MPKRKPPRKKGKRLEAGNLKSDALRERHQETGRGSKTPRPGGPIPIPYPRSSRKES